MKLDRIWPRNASVGLFLALLAGPTSVASAAEVVVFGDDWTASSITQLRASLAAAGVNVTVDDASQPGATTATVALTPQALADRVSRNHDARWVILSLGNNDFLKSYRRTGVSGIRAANIANLRKLLTRLFARHPNIRVVLFGVDWPNFTVTSTCRRQASAAFGPLVTTLQINDGQRRAVGDAYAAVAAEFGNVDYVDIFGTLQIVGGLPGAPNPAQPSSSAFMFDCTTPTAIGFQVITDALVDEYWQAPRPRAAPVIVPALTCLNQATMFTSASTAAVSNTWQIDGVVTSTQGTFVSSFPTTGRHTITLASANRAYTDAETVVIDVAACASADVGGMDAGTSDSAADGDTGAAAEPILDPGDGGIADADAGFLDATADGGFPDTGVDVGFPDTGVDVGFPDTGVDAGFPDTGVDVGFPDAGFPDAGADAGFPDTGVDAGFPDTGVDAGFPDTGVDAGFPDTGIDAGFPDTGIDAGFPDTGVDAGFPDTGVDAGFPDTGVDAGFPDTGIDAGFPDTGATDLGFDAGIPDAGFVPVDGGFPDAGFVPVDVGLPDVGVDIGFPDSGADAGFLDVGDLGLSDASVDLGLPDAGPDGGPPDSGIDLGRPDARVDAGFVANDAGASAPDTGVTATVVEEVGIFGSGCSTLAESPDRGRFPGWGLLIVVAALMLRRRQHRL